MKRVIQAGAVLLAALAAAAGAQVQPHARLSPEEENRVRDAQDPSERIKVYIEIEQARLDRFNEARAGYEGDQSDHGAYLNGLLHQYILLIDEMKDWIDDQYDRGGDMRAGLKALLDAGPKQLDELRVFQRSPGAYAAAFQSTLNDAVADLEDALDGSTKALSDQENQFQESKQHEKLGARAEKKLRKEEEKRNKEEKKLFEKMQKQEKKKKQDNPELL